MADERAKGSEETGRTSRPSLAGRASGLQRIYETRREYLAHSHTPAQKLLTYAFGPAILATAVAVMLLNWCWQTQTIVGCMALTWASWWPALWLSKQKRPGPSTLIVLVSSLAFVTLAMSLVGGLSTAGSAATLAITIHASLYSRRYLYYGIAGSLATFAVSQLFQTFFPATVLFVPEPQRLIVAFVLEVILVLLAGFYLHRIYAFSESLFGVMSDANRAQNKVIAAVNNIHPIIGQALDKIERISRGFAAKASAQAETAAEVNVTTNEVYQIAFEMVEASNETRTISETTREELIANSHRLQEVEQGFEKVVNTIQESRTDVIDLTNLVARIEEILDANQEIGQQIKILAVNAAIEAAKAREFGHGFRVVASKLRELIHITEENLRSSHALLEEIRDKSKESSHTIKLGAEQLLHYFEDLRTTGKTIESSAESFAQASRQVEQIGYAAQEQQVGMKAVAATMSALDTTAAELNSSAQSLLDTVQDITRSQEELRIALSAE